MKARITHHFICLGCGKYRDSRADAINCCAVVQEVWECSACSERFPSEEKANRHLDIIERQIGELTAAFYAASQCQTFDGISGGMTAGV